MNWAAFLWWSLFGVLVGIVAYLEFGYGRARARRRHPSNHTDPALEVRDVTTVDVRCTDCGRLIGIGVNVMTGDLVQHITFGQIVAAVLAHREKHHEAAA